jgi:prepilin-type N-terminal cleavage/methylation domain-containing protein
MKQSQKGFTLLEMLVSVAVFSGVVIGMYYFFDAGRWMYLHSEKKANMQENGRLAIEAMERDMRMIGFGVPKGTQFGSEVVWLPAVFVAAKSQIGFRGDVDNLNSWITQNVGSSDTVINVEYPGFVCPSNIPILIVKGGRTWDDYDCSSPTATTIQINPAAGRAYTAAEAEIFAPEHVFYRLTPDTDANGICDNTTDFSQCIIQRAIRQSGTPQTAPADPTNDWITFATNIEKLEFAYYQRTFSSDPNPLTTLPLAGNNLSFVDMIRITITSKDRSNKVQKYDSAEFRTDVVVRKQRY